MLFIIIRNEFLKVGRDLEISKGIDKDAYRIISEKIMQMYHQCRKVSSPDHRGNWGVYIYSYVGVL